MQAILSAILATLLLILPTSQTSPIPAVPPVAKVLKSIVRVAHPTDEGSWFVCAGFMVSQTAAITAQHCVISNELYVDGVESHLLKANGSLALLSAIPVKPPVELRSSPLLLGERLKGIGYGFAELVVFERGVARVADGDFAVDGPFVPGMSGGPVIDAVGKVVGLIQSVYKDQIGIACGVDEIKDFLKK